MSKTIDNIRAAYQQVQEKKLIDLQADVNGGIKLDTETQVHEGKFVIPEEIPANERTAFHGAAAAAAKAGKSHFNFGGKKHPVTMKKDTAKAIADDNAAMKMVKTSSNPMAMKKALDKSRHKEDVDVNEKYKPFNDPGKSANPETHYPDGRPRPEFKHLPHLKDMGKYKKPKNEKTEGYMKDLATADAKSDAEKAKVAADFKKRRKMKKDEKSDVQMNPKMGDSKSEKGAPMETKESTIREKLWSVLEGADRAKHYKGATKPEGMHDKTSPGGKEMMNQPTQKDDTEEKGHKDAVKAAKTGPTAKPRSGGDATRGGDQKIIPSATPVKGMKSTMEAYASMYEKEETDGD